MSRRRPPDPLTPREHEVLDLLRLGLTNEEIAGRLEITVAGAKYHVSEILSKLGVPTREKAAAWKPSERHPWYWKFVWLGGAGIGVTAAAAGLAAVLSVAGVSITLESEALGGGDDDSRGGATVRAVVADQNIAAGTEISEEMVKVIEVPEGQLVDGAFSDTAPVVGQVTKVAFAEGEQVTASKFGPPVPSSGVGKIVIPPGGRAFSFNIDSPAIDGELIVPGDRVDILIERDGQGSGATVIENVEVIAVGSSRVEESQIPPTITVAIEPERAELLAEALSSAGKIRLSRPV
jgi:Flp pilus assembly protein CpaB